VGVPCAQIVRFTKAKMDAFASAVLGERIHESDLDGDCNDRLIPDLTQDEQPRRKRVKINPNAEGRTIESDASEESEEGDTADKQDAKTGENAVPAAAVSEENSAVPEPVTDAGVPASDEEREETPFAVGRVMV